MSSTSAPPQFPPPRLGKSILLGGLHLRPCVRNLEQLQEISSDLPPADGDKAQKAPKDHPRTGEWSLEKRPRPGHHSYAIFQHRRGCFPPGSQSPDPVLTPGYPAREHRSEEHTSELQSR